jgi:hypothetical protein
LGWRLTQINLVVRGVDQYDGKLKNITDPIVKMTDKMTTKAGISKKSGSPIFSQITSKTVDAFGFVGPKVTAMQQLREGEQSVGIVNNVLKPRVGKE